MKEGPSGRMVLFIFQEFIFNNSRGRSIGYLSGKILCNIILPWLSDTALNRLNDTAGNDKTFVEEILAGHRPAFAAFIRNTEALVAQIIFKMIAEPAFREDPAQDI